MTHLNDLKQIELAYVSYLWVEVISTAPKL